MNIIKNTKDNQLLEVLAHYKKIYLSLGIILISVYLFLFTILPQIQQYTDQQKEMEEVKERISTLKQNLQYISSVSDDTQSKDIQVTTQALPGQKDYAGILYAIRTTSSKTGVDIGDYSFKVGDLSETAKGGKSIPVITMALNVNGDLKDISLFLSELAKVFPLSDVSEVSVSERFSELTVNFYYKPITSFKVNYTTPIKPIAGTNQKLIETLREWQTERPFYDIVLPIEASESASPFN